MTRDGRARVKTGNIRAIPLPGSKFDVAAGKCSRGKDRFRQGTGFGRVFLAVEIVAKHHRSIFDGVREHRIMVKPRAQGIQRSAKLRDIPQFLLGQLIQNLETGTFVRFGENHVKTDDQYAVFLK